MRRVAFARNVGIILTGIWLILWGLFQLIPSFNFSGKDTVMAILAIAAGVLLILGI